MKISHIVNTVNIGKESDLYIAQPVTFETMRIAGEFVQDKFHVELFSAQFPEDREMVPPFITRTDDLDRSILDIQSFRVKRKLPLLQDILDRLYEVSVEGYMIYTNVDIALMPNFYLSVVAIIEQGYDAFIINRRTIPDSYSRIEELPVMYAETGEKHKGWDCFVFRRDLYEKFDLGTGVIGQGWIGRILLANMVLHAEKFKIFEDLHLTFHIGNEKSWKTDKYRDYQVHNIRECKRFLLSFEEINGSLDRRSIPGSFLNLEPEINLD